MTFKDAVVRLARQSRGDNLDGAKRPCMRGYVRASAGISATEPGEDGEAPQTYAANIAIVSPGGEERRLEVSERNGGAYITGLSEGWKVTAELMDALIFADDWELAPLDELEKARQGASEM